MPTYKNRGAPRRHEQRGVLLIVVLIMLMVLSILASVSIRGASSSEQVSNQSRVSNLAQQAAEAALRYCETQVQAYEANPATGFAPAPAPFGAGAKYHWEAGAGDTQAPAGAKAPMSNWDEIDAAKNAFVASNILKVLPTFTAVGDAGALVYFKRKPECMSQYLAGDATLKTFITTARGFGPEVGAKDGNAPEGTEVWLQSMLTMK